MPYATALNAAERSDLRQHLQQCAHARGRLHRLRCTFEAFDAFLAPRLVSTLGAGTALVLGTLIWAT